MTECLQPQDGLPSSGPPVNHSEIPPISLRLFGSFEAQVAGVSIARLRSRRGQWLLALLALRAGRPVERCWLAGTLWPDSTEENALVSLRQTLTDLRRALGTERGRLASPTARTLRFAVDGVFIDVLAFDAALKRGDSESLEEAVRLHHRPLLDDCHEEWAQPERDHREHACLTALLTLANGTLASGNPEGAIVFLHRAVTTDPYREDARRGLMMALARSGSPGEAILVYRDLRLLLLRDLRTEPASETQALYEQIRREKRRPAALPLKTAEPVRNVSSSPSRSAALKGTGGGGNLPRPLTDLIGREHDVEEVGIRLFRSRLVTLIGMGGVGKTRLAIQVASAWAEDQPEGVIFVALASVAEATSTTRAVANALGIVEDPGRPMVETLTEALHERRFLLVLDNCEHLLDACAQLTARLLSACPSLVILTTSRQALGVMGETVWSVSPLALPSCAGQMSAEAVRQASAVQLFVDRASAALSGFACTDQNASAIAKICVRLDGVPLALELAAARIRVLTPMQIAERLSDRFGLLSQGSRAVLPRQQTLRALIDWSYDLLSEAERRLLGRCSVFVGGWTLEAAEAVGADTPAETRGVLDALTGLVDKSLVQVGSDESPERRYRLLETVRQYARERLGREQDVDHVLRRHRDWFLALIEAAQPHYRGANQRAWLNRLECEHDNLRAALEFSQEDEAGAIPQLSLAAGLWRFWMERGYFGEGRDYLTAALTRSTGAESGNGIRAKALNGVAAMAWHQGDLSAARLWMEEALRLSRLMNDLTHLESSLNNLGAVVYSQGDVTAARSFWEESLMIRRSLRNDDAIASTLNNLGNLAYGEGDFDRAEALHTEALTLVRNSENRHQRRAALIGLGNLREAAKDYENAGTHFEEALVLARDLDDKDCVCGSLTALAKIAAQSGDTTQAKALLREALGIARDTGMRPAMLDVLEVLAGVRLAEGEMAQAIRLWGMIEAQRQVLGLSMSLTERAGYDALLAHARAEMSVTDFAVYWGAGAVLSLDQAVAQVLGEGSSQAAPLLSLMDSNPEVTQDAR